MFSPLLKARPVIQDGLCKSASADANQVGKLCHKTAFDSAFLA